MAIEMRALFRREALALPALLLHRPALAAGWAFLSAAADGAGAWRAAAFAPDGTPRFEVPLPARGHGAAVAPDGATAVLFARRPGRFALVLDPADGRARQAIGQATGRWFCGHGAFSADGATLYATEIDAAGEGVVGVYAAGRGFARIGEFPTGGADPHDIRLAPGGRALWVANGGIRTLPEVPRARLDLEGFESSLVLLEAGSGRELARHALPEEASSLSLRHLAIAAGGDVFVAMQHEGPREEIGPLVARVGAGGLAALPAEAAPWRALDHYTGSAAASLDGGLVAVTSPRGGCGLVVDVATGRLRAAFALRDGCGVAAGPSGFVVTSGLGGARCIATDGTARDIDSPWLARRRWDNHLVAL
jgi:hypothetical protein